MSDTPAYERILENIGRQIDAGTELRRSDQLAAMTATAAKTREYYGATPATMEIRPYELPETVKSALAEYIV